MSQTAFNETKNVEEQSDYEFNETLEHIDVLDIRSWDIYAECRDTDSRLFFSREDKDIDAAKQHCRECPVRWQCLEYALVNKEEDGLWGGRTEGERKIISRQMKLGGVALLY